MDLNYEAVLFDLDGTLLNTLDDLGNAMNRVLSQHNFPNHELNAYKYFVGDGARMLIMRTLPDNQKNEETIQTCLEEFLRDYRQNWNVKTSVYPGISDMLDELSAREIRLAVLSNKPNDITQQCVEEYFSEWTFDVVLGQQQSVPQKPDPTQALFIAKELKIATSDFVYLGDTVVDMKTACRAGMFPVGVLWGFHTQKELEENGARVCLKEPSELFTSTFHRM